MSDKITAAIDELDAALGNSASLTAQEADYLRGLLRHLSIEAAGLIRAKNDTADAGGFLPVQRNLAKA